MSNYETVSIEIQGKEFEAQVTYTYTPEEKQTHDEPFVAEEFEFIALYLPGFNGKGRDMDIGDLLDFQHVHEDIIEQLKEQHYDAQQEQAEYNAGRM